MARRGDLLSFLVVRGGDANLLLCAIEPLAIVKDRIPKRFSLDPIRDIQVLCPMNRGGLGARSLNIELQKALAIAVKGAQTRRRWSKLREWLTN